EKEKKAGHYLGELHEDHIKSLPTLKLIITHLSGRPYDQALKRRILRLMIHRARDGFSCPVAEFAEHLMDTDPEDLYQGVREIVKLDPKGLFSWDSYTKHIIESLNENSPHESSLAEVFARLERLTGTNICQLLDPTKKVDEMIWQGGVWVFFSFYEHTHRN